MNKKNKILILSLLLVSIFTTGCQSITNKNDSYKNTEEVSNKYFGTSGLKGASIRVNNEFWGSISGRLNYINGNYFLSTRYSGKGWRFYKSAYLVGGIKLKVSNINRQVIGGGQVFESLSIQLSKTQLTNFEETGIDALLVGSRGDSKLFVPAYYVQGFMDKVNELNGTKKIEKIRTTNEHEYISKKELNISQINNINYKNIKITGIYNQIGSGVKIYFDDNLIIDDKVSFFTGDGDFEGMFEGKKVTAKCSFRFSDGMQTCRINIDNKFNTVLKIDGMGLDFKK
ncbi:MAG: hypothetical protein QM504_17405 [Pseudomonadota bacterium]